MWGARPAVALLLLVSMPALAVSKAELEARIQQLERKLDSQGLVQLLEQVEALQREVQQLRGDIEVQTHELKALQRRQRDLYMDIDRRLHRLEAGLSNGQQPAPPAAGGNVGEPGPSASAPATGRPAAAGEGASPPGATLNPAAERKDYDQALEVLRDGRYGEASAAFQAFLKKYPSSSYADNAQYWLGEVRYVTREFQPALSEFGKVIAQYPNSPKVADARLKIGYIKYELKDWAGARAELERVIRDFPASTAARLARERLDRMQREGH